MTKTWPSFVCALVVATVSNTSAQSERDQATLSETPTFTRDVLPIFQASCQECHRSGGMAPMALETYEEARPWARVIKRKVASREMPPWSSNLTVGEYSNDPSLTESQIA